MFNKVIVGDDGLDGGADALALAQALAPNAELVVASAFPWDSTPSRFVQLGYGKTGFPIVHGAVFDPQEGRVRDLDIDFAAILHKLQAIYNLTDSPLV